MRARRTYIHVQVCTYTPARVCVCVCWEWEGDPTRPRAHTRIHTKY